MSVLKWDQIGERLYHTGVKKGVVYPQVGAAYPKGYAWNGLTTFQESPDGADANDFYADDQKYLSIRGTEDFNFSISAYMYPDEFAACNGEVYAIDGVKLGQQTRKPFGFSCVTTIGNDTEYDEHGYIIHLVWGATASPSDEEHSSVNDSPDIGEFSWDCETIPVDVPGYKPVAHMELESTKLSKEQLKAIEDVLYGTDEKEASLPLPAAVIELLKTAGGSSGD